METKCAIFIDDLPRMLPTKFRLIWPSGYRGEDYLKIDLSETMPMAAMFVNGSELNGVEKINAMSYIFTLLVFGKPNKTTINKKETTIFYRSTSFRFSFIFRYSKVVQVS